MFPLKLKVYIMEGDRRIENFNKDQWTLRDIYDMLKGYFEGEEDPCMADSEIIFEDKEESLLERFNKMAVNSQKD